MRSAEGPMQPPRETATARWSPEMALFRLGVALFPGGLRALLQQIAAPVGAPRMPAPHAFDDASRVAFRLAETLPLEQLTRQKALEVDHPAARLNTRSGCLSQPPPNGP